MSGIKGFLNLCFIPHPLLQNHQKISSINCFDTTNLFDQWRFTGGQMMTLLEYWYGPPLPSVKYDY